MDQITNTNMYIYFQLPKNYLNLKKNGTNNHRLLFPTHPLAEQVFARAYNDKRCVVYIEEHDE